MKYYLALLFAFFNMTAAHAQKSFGFRYEIKNNKTVVSLAIPYGPSAKAGLQKGDIIAKVNAVDFLTLDTGLVATRLMEAPDNSVLTVVRNGATVKLTVVKEDRQRFLNICVLGNCQTGQGTFVDGVGQVYTGSFSSGVKTGAGSMQYDNGNLYTGNFVMNERHGAGKMNFSNGDTYSGNFNNGLMAGQGSYTTSGGDVYTGIYKSGRFDGNVVHYVNSTDETFEEIYKDGVFVSNKKIEKKLPPATKAGAVIEKINYSNGDSYYGYTFNKKREGHGKYNYQQGGFYEGNWADDKINGFGKYDNGKGFSYEGNWKDNIKDGPGKETGLNGNTIQQVWAGGKLNGNIVSRIHKDGQWLFTKEQLYVDDKATGNPKVMYANGDVYAGPWKNEKPSGYGVFTYKNGDSEKGNFNGTTKKGLVEFKPGTGKLVTRYYNYNVIDGVFAAGKLTYKNGNIYEGKWKDGLQEGAGKLTTSQEVMTGSWTNGNLNGKVTAVTKKDRSTSTYLYRDGLMILEYFNATKFTAQLLELLSNPGNKFQNIVAEKTGNEYLSTIKLNGFSDVVVKNYPAHISSTGKEAFVLVARVGSMTHEEALAFCAQLETVFATTNFGTPLNKEVEYNVATRRLINYNFAGKLPLVNLDALNGNVEIRIHK